MLRSVLRSVRLPWLDVVLAALLGALAVGLAFHGWNPQGDVAAFPMRGPGPDARAIAEFTGPSDELSKRVTVALNLLMTLPLVGRRRWPLVAFAVQFGALLTADIEVNPAVLAALLIGAYSLVVHGRSTPWSMVALLAAAGAVAAVKNNTWPPLPDWSGVFAILLPIGLFGAAIRAARSRAYAADQRAEALEREQQAATQLAVAQERARIARELHDVVSHHVSVMTIQAGAAGKVLDADPELARGALAAIEDSGRETMTELRHLMGVLTPGPADDLLHPQPGLDQLDALVDNVRQAGQPVSVERVPIELPRGLDLTAYRVVQEALTNALRHAPGARTDIAISTDSTDLLIEVTNDAAPRDAVPPDAVPPDAVPLYAVPPYAVPPHAVLPDRTGTGSGLLGLAERLRLYGGTLETGRRPGGGFRMRARLPLGAAP